MRRRTRQRGKVVTVAAGVALVTGVLVASGTMANARMDDMPETRGEPGGRCDVTRLPMPDGDVVQVSVASGDPSGRYLVGAKLADDPGKDTALLWHDDEVQELAGPSDIHPNLGASGVAVNGSGAVLGATSTGRDEAVYWIYRDGRYTKLKPPSGTADGGWDVNERGDILGAGIDGPVVWPEGDTENPVELETNGDPNLNAAAINDDGAVVGASYDSDAAYVWRDVHADPEELPTDGLADFTVDNVVGDWAVGGGYTADNDSVGLLWNLADGTVERLPGSAWTVNTAGDVIVSNGPWTFPDLLRSNGETTTLPPLPDGKRSGGDVLFDRGSQYDAVGWSERADGTMSPVAWTC